MGFSPLDSQTFYLATQYLLATHDKGIHWEQASPDLTAADEEATKPPSDNPPGRGSPVPAIGALAFSPQDAKVIWAGTTNGLIQLTRDGGGHWDNVASGDLAKTPVALGGRSAPGQRQCPGSVHSVSPDPLLKRKRAHRAIDSRYLRSPRRHAPLVARSW